MLHFNVFLLSSLSPEPVGDVIRGISSGCHRRDADGFAVGRTQMSAAPRWIQIEYSNLIKREEVKWKDYDQTNEGRKIVWALQVLPVSAQNFLVSRMFIQLL